MAITDVPDEILENTNTIISDVADVQTDVTTIEGCAEKIDNAATDGLAGVEDSVAYRIHEVERHLHNFEKWFGAAAVASGETHVADRMAGGISAFALVSGNDAFNATWTQVLGSADLPVGAGMVKADAHRVMVTSTDSTAPFIIQFVTGESADIAAKISAEEFTEIPYVSATNNADSGVSDIISRRIDAGEKVWARCACIGQDAKTINLYVGIHEYEG